MSACRLIEADTLGSVIAKEAYSTEDTTRLMEELAPKALTKPGIKVSKLSVFMKLSRLVILRRSTTV